MQTFFQKNNSDELIVFFNGWGMDETPFYPLKSCRDLLFIFDYSDSDLTLDLDFSKYKKLILMSFSAGVFMAAYFQDLLPDFHVKIAINGTLHMLDEHKGVPPSMFKEMESLTYENALEFREKITDNKDHYNLFNKYQPLRNLESSMEELFALKRYFAEPKFFDYDKVIVGKSDIILPTENQLRAWNNHKNVHKTSGGHFLFYNFNDFDELVAL